MTVAFVEQSAESLTNAQQRKNPQKAATGSELFSSLLDGRLPSNIVFTRADAALAPPKGAEKREGEEPVVPYRDDNREEPVYADDDVEEPVSQEHYDASASQPVQHDAPRSDSTDHDQATAAAQPTNSNADQQAAEARRNSQNHQGDTTAQARTEAAATKTDTAKSAAAAIVDPNAQAAAKTKTDTSAAKVAVDPALQKAAEVSPVVTEKVSKNAQNNANQRAYVHRAADPVSAQPQSSLSAQASVTAQETTDTKAINDALRNAGLATLADDEALAGEGAGKTNAKTGIIPGAAKAAQNAQKPEQAQQQGPDLSALAAQAAQNQQVSAAAAANVQQSANSFTNAQAGQSMAIDASAGAGQLNGTTSGAQQRAAVAQAHTPHRPQVPHQALADQVAVQINKAAENGVDRINIQLRPADLGRVDVKMEVGHDGRVSAVISVERQETLDMLRQDSRVLTQALQDAGLQADESTLSFNLQGQEGQSANANSNGGAGSLSGTDAESQIEAADDGLLALGETPEMTEDGRLDVKV